MSDRLRRRIQNAGECGLSLAAYSCAHGAQLTLTIYLRMFRRIFNLWLIAKIDKIVLSSTSCTLHNQSKGVCVSNIEVSV
jgi:hypothetical protein